MEESKEIGELTQEELVRVYHPLPLDENPNDLWTHAIPLESQRKEQDIRAEADFMRELFLSNLPTVGSNKSTLISYFDRLQEAIENGEPIEYDGFDDNLNSESASSPRDYKYFSATLFKERSSRHPLLPDGEAMDDSTDCSEPWSPTHDQCEKFEAVPLIPKCENGEDPQDDGPQ